MIGPGSDNDKLGTYWILYLFPVVPVEQMARLEVDQSWGPRGNLNISLLKSKMTFANWTRSFPMMTIHCTQSPLRVVVRKKRDLVGKIGSFSHIIPFFLTTTLFFYHNSDYCTVNSTLSRCTILQSVQLLSHLPNVPSEQTTNNAKQPQAGRLHKTG